MNSDPTPRNSVKKRQKFGKKISRFFDPQGWWPTYLWWAIFRAWSGNLKIAMDK